MSRLYLGEKLRLSRAFWNALSLLPVRDQATVLAALSSAIHGISGQIEAIQRPDLRSLANLAMRDHRLRALLEV